MRVMLIKITLIFNIFSDHLSTISPIVKRQSRTQVEYQLPGKALYRCLEQPGSDKCSATHAIESRVLKGDLVILLPY
jgi:hypothetical protein